MRGSQVRELVQQVAVRPNFISCHLSMRERGQKNVDNIVGQCPAIVRKAHWGAGVECLAATFSPRLLLPAAYSRLYVPIRARRRQ